MITDAAGQNYTTRFSKRVSSRRRVTDRPTQFTSRLRRFALIFAVSAGTIAVAGVIAFAYFYNHYSALVDQRVRSGFWHSRGGVYSAPRRLHVGSRASIDSVEEALRRSGFVEGASTDGVFNGSFKRSGSAVTIIPSTSVVGGDEIA